MVKKSKFSLYPHLFRELQSNEIDEFKKWARENYIPGDAISEVWNPVVQEECSLINKEQRIGK